jgi:hypothetical protein
MKYLFLLLPLLSLLISYRYKAKFRKLKNSGKIGALMNAKNKATLFLVLAILLALGFIFKLMFNIS